MNPSIKTTTRSRLDKALCMLALFGSACAGDVPGSAELAQLEQQAPYLEDAPSDAAEAVGATQQALQYDSTAMGWVWGYSPTTSSYTPSTDYSFNVQGGTNTIRRLSLGHYRVDMPRLGTPHGGNAQVTAYGSTPHRCNLQREPYNSGTTVRIEVNCYDGRSQPADTYFVAFFHNYGDVSGNVAAGTFEPEVEQLRQPNNMYLYGTKLDTGRYRITMDPSMRGRGAAFVTAIGRGIPTFCNPSAHANNTFEIRCFNAVGGPVDSAVSFSNFYQPIFYNVNAAFVRGASTSTHTATGYYSDSGLWESAFMTRNGTGSYAFTFYEPVMDSYPAPTTTLVSANMSSPYHCKPTGWGLGGDFTVGIQCFDYRGNPANAWVEAAAFGFHDYGVSLLPL